MFPIRDTEQNNKLPVMTILLIALNSGIYLMMSALDQRQLAQFFYSYAFIADFFQQSLDAQTLYLPLVSSMFIHGDIMHLLGNMWALWIFGDNVEESLGPFVYVIFYILAGVIAILAHAYSDISSLIPTVGASGAIAGVMGAYLILFKRSRVLTFIAFPPFFFKFPAQLYLVIWFVGQLYSGVFSQFSSTAIAWWAHIAGFVFGVMLALIWRRRQ